MPLSVFRRHTGDHFKGNNIWGSRPQPFQPFRIRDVGSWYVVSPQKRLLFASQFLLPFLLAPSCFLAPPSYPLPTTATSCASPTNTPGLYEYVHLRYSESDFSEISLALRAATSPEFPDLSCTSRSLMSFTASCLARTQVANGTDGFFAIDGWGPACPGRSMSHFRRWLTEVL